MHRTALLSVFAACWLGASACAAQATRPEPPAVQPVEQLAEYPSAPFEDGNGNLWFQTVLKGVIRYDGQAFTNYTAEDGLGSNTLRGIAEANDGTLYFATTGGLTRYNGKTFVTLTDYEPLEVTPGFGEHGNHRDLWDVHIDHTGQVWIATTDGVFRLDGGRFVRFPLPAVAEASEALFFPRMVACVYEDPAGDLWFGTDGAGVFRYDGREFTAYTSDDGLVGNNVRTIMRDSKGRMWFGTSNAGMSIYEDGRFTTVLRNKEHSRHTGWGRYLGIVEDRDGNVWIGVTERPGGVYRSDGESFEYLGAEHGLAEGGVPSIALDRSGNVWLGTTAGVYRYLDGRFVNFTEADPGDWAPNPSDPPPGWFAERIEFPPPFAHDLPAGHEDLRFPPGWRKPTSEMFWSYAITMHLDEPEPDADRIATILERYYDGLMHVFGVDEIIDPATVVARPTAPGVFEADMEVIDGFATYRPMLIRIKITTDAEGDGGSVLRVRLSPQPDDHPVWHKLQDALDRNRCGD